MILSLIVAMTKDRVIGKGNGLPWHLSDDLKRFKKITMGHPIIMGRKTFDSIGRPLPGRQNIVVTRDRSFKIEGADVVHSLEEALRIARIKDDEEEVFVIGGSSLFQEALPRARRLYLTLIHEAYEGDVYFPDIPWEKIFHQVSREKGIGRDDGREVRYTYIQADK